MNAKLTDLARIQEDFDSLIASCKAFSEDEGIDLN